MSSSCLARSRRRPNRCLEMPDKDDRARDVAVNRRAYHDYFIDEKYEADVMLTGNEVKSIRNGAANLPDGFVRNDNGEAWQVYRHISQYLQWHDTDNDPTQAHK